MVYVLNKNGQPLMPTENHRMVRMLLKEKKAKVVRRTPFTIKLIVKTKGFTQPIVLGVDAGSKTIGFSASTELQELYSAELKPRNDVVNNLSREMYKLPKTHVIDALCIAKHPKAKRLGKVYLIKPVRNHNRQLHKATILKYGIRKKNKAATYVKDFRLFDKVLYNNQECFVWGRRTSGSMLLRLLDGTSIKDGAGYRSLKLLERSSNYLII